MAWSLIAGRLPGRTANDIKNYWNTHMRKKLETESKNPAIAICQEAMETKIIRPQPWRFTKNLKWLKPYKNTTLGTKQIAYDNLAKQPQMREDGVSGWQKVLPKGEPNGAATWCKGLGWPETVQMGENGTSEESQIWLSEIFSGSMDSGCDNTFSQEEEAKTPHLRASEVSIWHKILTEVEASGFATGCRGEMVQVGEDSNFQESQGCLNEILSDSVESDCRDICTQEWQAKPPEPRADEVSRWVKVEANGAAPRCKAKISRPSHPPPRVEGVSGWHKVLAEVEANGAALWCKGLGQSETV
ncbi:unnamed protein product [Thlaspi arvense]|uniref:Uncharacterized protein n=1 Tax=Thlaspi arvense TaxID=13288 RepID=A0AAU9RUR4_THLAR|nr:unnamed protein product [Thlaspi arvense]